MLDAGCKNGAEAGEFIRYIAAAEFNNTCIALRCCPGAVHGIPQPRGWAEHPNFTMLFNEVDGAAGED